ncbi:MAG: amidase [Pseudomonadales bacterium]|nr:amidase [Pseudomonadales bacterium]
MTEKVAEKPSQLDATTARKLIGEGVISPVDLLESCIDQIDELDGVVNAMVTRAYHRARGEAQAAKLAVKKGEVLGVLHGLPVAIKDIHLTEGIRTSFGSEKFKDNIPEQDSGIVHRIRQAGGIVIGKTNVPEGSIGANTVNSLFGATGNPFNPDLTCGGSSGGSGVAVATNMVPLATGSDHGGSLRIPACYSGVVGYRATPGVVPNEARATLQTNYSVQGPMARTVSDAALLLSVIAERDNNARKDPMAFPLDASKFSRLEAIDISRLRIAITVDLGGVLVSETIRNSFESKMQILSRKVAVCDLHDINLSDAPDVDWHLRQDLFVTQYFDQAKDWTDDFNPNIKATYYSALDTSMASIAAARRKQMQLYQSFASIFSEYDLVICPGVSIPPFPWKYRNPEVIDGKTVDNYMAWLALTSSLTVVGHPVLALPCGLDEQGTPFGIQVIGQMYADHKLLSAGASIERFFGTHSELARPIPNFEVLSKFNSSCRSLGKLV